MSLPLEAEELLDDLRRKKLDEALSEIAMLIAHPISGDELQWMQILERIILKAYHQEGGYAERQHICEEIARLHQ